MRHFDAHVHLDLMTNAREVARECAAAGLGALSCTVTPAGYLSSREALEAAAPGNVFVALGAHPWWVARGKVGEQDLEQTVALIKDTRLVGEVGLDFSTKHVPEGTAEVQVNAFRHIVEACVETSDAAAPKVLSIHSVRAADTVLDILEKTGATTACRCIFHWFSASNEELWRAIRAGCWFSFGERSMATGRGREYARLIPDDRLLTETDYPPRSDAPGSAAEIEASLDRALAGLAAARGEDVTELVVRNAEALLA